MSRQCGRWSGVPDSERLSSKWVDRVLRRWLCRHLDGRVAVSEKLNRPLADLGINDDQLLKGREFREVAEPMIAHRCPAQVQHLNVGKVLEKLEIVVRHVGPGERDDDHVRLPDTVAPEGFDAFPGSLSLMPPRACHECLRV